MARVVVDVMPKPEILDPQGKAVTGALRRLGFQGLQVRQGKRFEIEVDGELTEARLDDIREAAGLLLANTVIETFEVRTDGQDAPSTADDAPSREVSASPGDSTDAGEQTASETEAPDVSQVDSDPAEVADLAEAPGAADAEPVAEPGESLESVAEELPAFDGAEPAAEDEAEATADWRDDALAPSPIDQDAEPAPRRTPGYLRGLSKRPRPVGEGEG